MSTIRQNVAPKVFAWTGRNADLIDLSPYVMSIAWTKDMDSPCATFQVTLLPHTGPNAVADPKKAAELYALLPPGTVLSLGMDTLGGFGVGLVTGCERAISASDGQVTYAISLHGNCLGKLLVNDALVVPTLAGPGFERWQNAIRDVLGETHPLADQIAGLLGPRRTFNEAEGPVRTFKGATVREVAEFVLSEVTSARLPLLRAITGGDGSLADYIDLGQISTWHDGRVWSEGLSDARGNIWEFLRSMLDPELYEIRLDYVPSGYALPLGFLIIRPKPFDGTGPEAAPVAEQSGAQWEDVVNLVDGAPYHEIGTDELFQARLGRSDDRVYTFYDVSSAFTLLGNTDAAAHGLGYPLLDLYNVQRFGLRELRTRLSLVGGDLELLGEDDRAYNGALASEVQEARNRLFNWHRWAGFYEGGTLVVAGRDAYRVGDRVRLPWAQAPLGDEQGMIYYCVGVSHEWSLRATYRTTLRLARGHNGEMLRILADEAATLSGNGYSDGWVAISITEPVPESE